MAAASRTKRASASRAAEPGCTQGVSLTSLLRVLADPTRMRIFLLLREGEACVCELADTLQLAENLVSHHLSVLRRAGLVRDRREASDARWVYYTLDAAALSRLHDEVGALFDPRTLGTRTPTCGPAVHVTASTTCLTVPSRAQTTPVSCGELGDA
jgi:DNA-binding transcriptional ArsR family regulator